MQVPVLSTGSRAAAVCLTALLATSTGTAPAAAPALDRGDILVADTEALFAPGGVFRIDPVTGAQS